MKLLIIAIALSLFAAPAFAACSIVGASGDHPNHQSSLSSTTEGGSPGHLVCTES